jgi:hypothetical protein
LSFEEAELKLDGLVLKISLLEMENATLAFFYEGRIAMGTLAVALPGSSEVKAGTSSILLGGRYLLSSRALAERVTAALGKMSLVSVRTTLPEGEALRSFAKLFENVLSKRSTTSGQ